MNEITFADTDTGKIKDNIIQIYESLSGRTLARADPIRLFLESVAAIIVQQRVIIDYGAKMNLLYYAEGNYLDHLGLLVGAERLKAVSATTTIRVTLSNLIGRAVVIPKGTRIATSTGILFATDKEIKIHPNTISGDVIATCIDKGDIGNEFAPGDIKTIVDPIPYVASMININTSEGGADDEGDEPYRERIKKAPHHFSVAGPVGAYEYFAKSASSLISDVSVASPSPGCVDVYVLQSDNPMLSDAVKMAVENALGDDVRPLTDKVEVKAPAVINYDIDLTYYINSRDSALASDIRGQADKAINDFIVWQKSKLGRDVNPSRLISDLIKAGVKRVDLVSPIYKQLTRSEVADISSVNIHYGGLEDD